MYTFVTDESRVYGREAQEYGLSIYGGLVMNERTFSDLTKWIYKLKERYVLPQELDLKWRFETVWNNMRRIGHVDSKFSKSSHPEMYKSLKEDYDGLKSEIVDEVSESDARIIIAIRPNRLLQATSSQAVDYAIRAVAKKFERFLRREGDLGIILADELQPRLSPNDVIDYQYILKLCHAGSGGKFDRVINIVPTIDSCVSPIHQINDIVLGVMQYYVLEFMRKLNDSNWNIDAAKNHLEKITKNFYTSAKGGYIINNGILLYPPKINRMATTAGLFLDKLEAQLKTDFNIH